ncbi:uncharacterized protein LOC119837813 [Zerene cesonia]|uniref:uncharacterized protein LOC119837813 n=1 Tax=Zerene cesonia TaxID=33412 RepID=UPI0018E50247|nr:uncharacterized protein LOC119837813 [Zerene cesonia]XP_038219510.1 uncharacterized protein LOC119837813 [Zerene cesonia]
MAPNFSKNAVLTGLVDYYCLVCEFHSQNEDNITEHVAMLTHKNHLEDTFYDIEEECIRKIKQWYFCEFCNQLIKTKAKLRLHIAEKLHVVNKFRQSLLRCDGVVIAFGVIAISNSSWNGLCGGTCLICNCEYTDEKEHLDTPMHSINLIQNNIESNNQNHIYRLIDATSFHCLTCNTLESITSLGSHFTVDSHTDFLEKCRQRAKSFLNTMAVNKISPAEISPKHDELKRQGSTSNIKFNENSSTLNIEINEKSSLENTEFNAITPTENLESNAMSSPENIELNAMSSQENIELNAMSSQENIELNAMSTSENIELNAMSSSENIELNARSSPENVEMNAPNVETNAPTSTENIELNEQSLTENIEKEININQIKEGNVNKESSRPKRKTAKNANINQNQKNNVEHRKISEREETVCKILNAENYIVPFENGKMMCILCEWAMEPCHVTGHVTSTHHENILKLHKVRIQKLNQTPQFLNKSNERNENNSNVDCNKTLKDISDDPKILESIEYLQNNSIEVNFETNSVMCKKCSKSIDFNLKSIQMHINEHKPASSAERIKKEPENLLKAEKVAKDVPSPQKTANTKHFSSPVSLKQKRTESSPSQDDLENFAKENKLKYKPGSKDVFCEQCGTRVPLSMKNMKEHINGSAHKSRNELSTKVKNAKVETIQIHCFVKDMTAVHTEHQMDFVLNGEFCITFTSMLLIRRCENSHSLRCLVCLELLNTSNPFVNMEFLMNHSQRHLDMLDKIAVVTNIPSEFIRVVETQSNCYHCGYCNNVYSWEKLNEHFQTNNHKENKNFAKYRLEQYLPDIVLNRRRERHEQFLMECLLKSFISNMR